MLRMIDRLRLFNLTVTNFVDFWFVRGIMDLKSRQRHHRQHEVTGVETVHRSFNGPYKFLTFEGN